MEGKKLREKVSKNLGIPRKVGFFLEILENAVTVPFATGSCQKFKPDVQSEWKAPYCLPSFYARTGIACASPTENTIFKGGKFFTNSVEVLIRLQNSPFFGYSSKTLTPRYSQRLASPLVSGAFFARLAVAFAQPEKSEKITPVTLKRL